MYNVMLAVGDTFDMASLLSSVTTFFTSLISWFGELLTFVSAQPLLLVWVLLTIAGVAIGFIRRWLPSGV